MGIKCDGDAVLTCIDCECKGSWAPMAIYSVQRLLHHVEGQETLKHFKLENHHWRFRG